MGIVRYRRDPDGKLRKVVAHEGFEGFIGTWTESCTGCCEFGEYGSNTNGHPFDPKAMCHVGDGCHECGYRGKRRCSMWIPFDISAWSRHEKEQERLHQSAEDRSA